MTCKKISFLPALSCLLLFLLYNEAFAAGTDTMRYVYVSLRGDDAVVLYKVNRDDGSPEKIYEEAVSGGPASLALDPSKRFLYVARRSANMISAYRIDPSTGRLTFINAIEAVDNPVYLSVDKTGRFLLSAYYNASKAAIYPIGANGALRGTASTIVTTDLNPHAIRTDNSNRFLYVTNMTGNSILQYAFDTVAGTITALDPARLVPAEGTGPRHLAFHGTKNMVYVVNETGNSVTAYRINDSTGVLTACQTVSTLPDDYTGNNKCADIHITPDNGFLYASNRGHESIAAFAVDTADGSLTPLDRYPTVNTPRAFAVDPSGTCLYAAGESSDDIAWYRIDKTSGVLDSLGCIPAGKTPSWVLAVEFIHIETSAEASSYSKDPSDHGLKNIPNPFCEATSIHYFVERPSRVTVNIYDITGRLVSTLVDGQDQAGPHSVEWKTAGMPSCSSVYYCRLETGHSCDTVRLVQVR